MNIEDIFTLVFAGLFLASLLACLIYCFVKYGTKQLEADYKCRKAQIKFYEMATLYLENKVNLDLDKRSY